MLRHALGVVDVIERAAPMLRRAIALEFRQTPLVSQLHGEANDRMALLLQHRGDCGRIDAAGHRYRDESGLALGDFRQRVELSFRGHALSILARGRFLAKCRRNGPELRNGRWDNAKSKFDVGSSSMPSEAEAQTGARILGGESNGCEYMRGLDGSGRTRCAGGNGQPLQVQRDEQRFAFDAGKKNVGRVRCARGVAGVDMRLRNCLQQTAFELISQIADPERIRGK
jgi:hypothetical protein